MIRGVAASRWRTLSHGPTALTGSPFPDLSDSFPLNWPDGHYEQNMAQLAQAQATRVNAWRN